MNEARHRSPEGLTDEQLNEYIDYWRERAEGYRRRRAAVDRDHPDAFRLGYSGWWCSKYLSSGIREQQLRQGQRKEGGDA